MEGRGQRLVRRQHARAARHARARARWARGGTSARVWPRRPVRGELGSARDGRAGDRRTRYPSSVPGRVTRQCPGNGRNGVPE